MNVVRRRADESGVALLTVIGISFAMLLVVTAATAYAVNTMPQVRGHEDWNAALAAAEAGVEDALYRLNQNAAYWGVEDPDNEARTGWRAVPGGPSDARYHYHLDAAEVGRTGAVDVVSTGRVGTQQRTVEVRLRRDGFLDYIYFTDFESSDPFGLPTVTNAQQRTYLDTYCARRYPERDTSAPSNTLGAGGCGSIRFVPGDVVDGPSRSNDALLIRSGSGGPRFLGQVTTGWDWQAAGSSLPYVRDDGSSGDPYFQDGVQHAAEMPVPETSRSIAAHAEATGCRYEGPTYLRFSSSPSQVTVISPLTDPADAGPGCGGGDPADGSPAGGIAATVPLKDGEVIYVGDSSRTGVGTHPLEMPRPDDNVNTFNPTAGDAFVHGEVDGQVTVAAENDVVVVWDLVYRDTTADSDDLLGLIADNNVWVYHPVNRTLLTYRNLGAAHADLPPFRRDPGTGLPGGDLTNARVWEDPEIHAAILALNRSFGVQAYNRGAPMSGELTVYGAIAQRWRGPVAATRVGADTLTSGYPKDYRYDWRLQYLTPPHFLEPELSPWTRRRWAEVELPAPCAGDEVPEETGCLPPA